MWKTGSSWRTHKEDGLAVFFVRPFHKAVLKRVRILLVDKKQLVSLHVK